MHERWTVEQGDCRDVMRAMPHASVDAIVSDPPYGLAFMGKGWDHAVPGVEFWAEALRVAKPGAHLVAFGGTRTFHRLAVAIEDAGWEVRDCLSWNFGSGFPKSHNIDKTGVSCACDDDVPGMRPRVLTPTVSRDARQSSVLLAEVQRDGEGQGVGEARTQGVQGPQAVEPDVRPCESRVEGRRDDEASEGQLLGRSLRPCAKVGVADGAEGRLHLGASTGDGATGGSVTGKDGGGASPEPRPVRQQAGKLGAVANERSAQESGVWPTCNRCGKPRITRGLGTALKPAWEPIILARKPLTGTVAANVAQHGTGGLNVDGCRIAISDNLPLYRTTGVGGGKGYEGGWSGQREEKAHPQSVRHDPAGRWPANVCLDEDAAAVLDEQSGERGGAGKSSGPTLTGVSTSRSRGRFNGVADTPFYGDSGGASRFFYTAKASRREREAGLDGMPLTVCRSGLGGKMPTDDDGRDRDRFAVTARNVHPTVKPIALMRWLCRLVTPPGGLILDPFTGSGTTGCAAVLEGFRFHGAELDAEYAEIARRRIAYWAAHADADAKQPTQLDLAPLADADPPA
jgi:hypothetical protein